MSTPKEKFWVTNWTSRKVKTGEVVEVFDEKTKKTNHRLVINVEQETEYGSLVSSLPLNLSRNRLIKSIQIAAIKKAFV